MGLFEGLVHPALAWGALLASVPLLIHLFNRQRHKPMPWAAMRFVMEAYRRTRRRTQLESLLLLLLRMAAVALLAFAVARPFTGKDGMLAPLTESRRDLILILDGSASTGYGENVGSVFESELERAREILQEFDGTRGDRVRLYLAGARARMLSARAPEDALSMLATLSTPTHESLDLGVVLAEVVGDLEDELDGSPADGVEIRILSDLQRRSFRFTALDTGDEAEPVQAQEQTEGPPEPGEPSLARALDRLAELEVDVIVEDLGPAAPIPPNVGIESVMPLGEVLGPGLATDIGVRVRNYGGEGRAGVRVVLLVDGERMPSQEVELAARAASEVVFSVVFSDGGEHAVEARLEGDRLAIDDARARVLRVPPPTRVLLVNGAPHDDVEKDELGYLRVILEPTDDGGLLGANYLPFHVRTQTMAQFSSGDGELNEVDVVVLANTGLLSPRLIESLERSVAAGASLIITLGDRYLEPSSIEGFNARMWRADGSGLSPVRLSVPHLSTRRERYNRTARFDAEHPALAFFDDERWRPLLTEVPVRGFVACEPTPGARVLAQLDDPDESPLLVERSYDRGRVFLWTTSIDADWTRFPESPASFVPLVHELLRYAGRGPLRRRNVGVGEVLQPELDTFPRSPSLLSPNGTRRAVDDEPVEVAEGVWRLGPIGPLDEVGLWTLETQDGARVSLAVELDPEEGDLQRMSPSELESSHSVWRVLDERGGQEGGGDERPGQGELWRWFAGAALAALILETLWAAWIGRSRRRA